MVKLILDLSYLGFWANYLTSQYLHVLKYV